MRRSIPLSLLLLGGCLGKDIQPVTVPPVPPPTAWRTENDGAGVFDAAWWKGFGDPALAALVEQALANNSDIAIAAGRVREARGNLQAVSAALLPTIDVGLAGGRSRSVSGIGTPLVQNYYQPLGQASYEVDLFGRLADQKSAARDALLASEAAHDAIRLAVASAVASSYIALAGLDARLEVARATLAARSESLRIAQSRVDRGYSPTLELDQARAEYQAAVQIVPQAELAITRIEDSLSQLVGDTPHAIQRGAKLDGLAVVTVPAGLPSELLRRRPDIAQAEYQLAAADSSLAAARKRFLPQLRLSVSGGVAVSSALVDPITLWSLGGSVLAPLFQGGRLTGATEAAAGQRDQAAFAYRRAALGAFREVEDALAGVQRLDEQAAAATAQRDALREVLRRATNRYKEGYSPYLEQIDAQRQLLGAELALVQARSDALSARVQLYAALGGGWTPGAQDKP
jgi:NodT family efflux transporter outer membrane factor (OMF) lipoprotein